MKLKTPCRHAAHLHGQRGLPFLAALVIMVAASGTTSQAQANFAGTESVVTSLQNEMVTGFTVDPAGNIYLCDASANQLDEAVYSAGRYGALTPIVQGMCSPNSPQPPLAVDSAGYFYYFHAGQLLKAQLAAGSFGSSIVVASGLSNPATIVLDWAGDVYISDNGTGRVLLVRINTGGGGGYIAPITVMSGVSGISYLAVDGQQNVYAAGGHGPSNGFVVKTTFNLGSYSAPQALYSSFDDLNGLTVDTIGDVFVSSDDSYQSPISGNVNGPGAIVDLWEIPITADGTYGLPVPKGGGDFYIAQGAASDGAGDVFVMWISGPKGGFTYFVERVTPNEPQSFGSVSVGSTSQQTVTFWVTGTEATPPTITVSAQGAGGKDFITAGGTTCMPDAGVPFYTDGYPVACTATVTFTPQTTGVRTGGALLISGDTGKPIAGASLTGVGAGPHLALNPGASALFSTSISPVDATATDVQGNFYTYDFSNHSVVKLPWNGSSFGAAVDVATGLQFVDGLAVDGFGNVFISDSGTGQVSIVPWTGSGYGPVTAILTQTSFYFEGGTDSFLPAGVVVDFGGNVFVLELDIFNTGNSVIVELPRRGDGYGPAFEVSGDGFMGGQRIATDGTNLFVVVDGPSGGLPGGYEQVVEFQRQPNTYPGFNPPVTVVGELATYMLSADGNGNLYFLDQSFTALSPDEVVEIYFSTTGISHARTVYTLVNGELENLAVGADGTLLAMNGGSYTVVDGNVVPSKVGAGLIRVDRSVAAAEAFQPTNVGATSTDSPRKVLVENIGNQPLNFASLTYPADFPKASGDSSACATAATLVPAASCDLPIQFTPLSSGPHTESVSFTDNSLNHAATQSIAVNGTGNGPVADAQIQLSLSNYAYTYPAQTVVIVKVLPNGSSTRAATGTVKLYGNGNNLLTTLTLSGAGGGNAAAYYQLPVLPAATYTLQGVYSGDAHNPSGSSPVLQFTVAPSPVTLSVSCTNSTIVYGTNLDCSVYGSPIAATSGTYILRGFDDGPTTGVNFFNGRAFFTIYQPAVGAHTISISYPQQNQNYASTVPQTIHFTVVAKH